MSEAQTAGTAVELTTSEAKLIAAALRQFEPYWPSDMDDLSRAQLMAEIRGAVDHLVATLDPGTAPGS
ncbi:MAG TPA: hypothetical protein VH085_03045 [Nocardioides sp.]|nr:hypothetical protein [Nocardioides sp.]